jgi:hypothetical protein
MKVIRNAGIDIPKSIVTIGYKWSLNMRKGMTKNNDGRLTIIAERNMRQIPYFCLFSGLKKLKWYL